MTQRERTYLCIDLKSYYASVECVRRHLDPLQALLLVADESRTDKTICLAVSPALKAMGVPSRPRLFEARQAIGRYEAAHRTHLPVLIAPPHMNDYIRISARIVEIYLRYVAPEDLHVYSIDECFLDITPYLHLYSPPSGVSAAHHMAMTIIREVLSQTGITATAGIGSNMYLAKVAMDIVAKKKPADANGVRIACLTETDYREVLWDHVPLTDFWQVGPGTARRLARYGVRTMGDLAAFSQSVPSLLYRNFGINAQLLIDHAFGRENCTMRDIKSYLPKAHSLSSGQVLAHPTSFRDARLILEEMIDGLTYDMHVRGVVSRHFVYYVGFDPMSLEVCHYTGLLALDYYGRLHPAHAAGSVRLPTPTSGTRQIRDALTAHFDHAVDHRLLVRRLGVAAEDLCDVHDPCQPSFLEMYADEEKERKLQCTLQALRAKYGTNIVLRGINYCEAGTARERNLQIGGHKG